MAACEINKEIDPRVVQAAAWQVRHGELDVRALITARNEFGLAILDEVNRIHDESSTGGLPTIGTRLVADGFRSDKALRIQYMPGNRDVNPEDQIWQ